MSDHAGTDHDQHPLRGATPLGHWRGIALYAHWSVLLIVALLTQVLAISDLPRSAPGQSTFAYWSAGSVVSVTFLVTIALHELAHAVVARHYGMTVRSLTLWALGGLTDLGGEPKTPRAEAMVALAGPAVTLVIGGASAALALWGGSPPLVHAGLVWMATISIILAVFNLLPAAPLDGGRLLRAAVWHSTHDRARANAVAARAGRVLGIALVVLGLLELLVGSLSGIWFALIGYFLMTSANAERVDAATMALPPVAVADVMEPCAEPVPSWWTVADFLDRVSVADAMLTAWPLVDMSGAPAGVLTAARLHRVPPDGRHSVRLRDLVPYADPAACIDGRAPVSEALAAVRAGRGVAVVTEDGRPIGVLPARRLQQVLELARAGWPGKADSKDHGNEGRMAL